MKNFYVIKYEDNWADEMDVFEYTILSEEQMEKLWDAIMRIRKHPNYKETTWTISHWIGTNEEIFYSSLENLLDTFTYFYN